MGDLAETRRPPADRLFCRWGEPCAVRPDMPADEQAHFAEHFAGNFAAALSEVRESASPSPNPLP